ncbi:TonB-dependent receptor domain-containing protein [Runella sp. SP2]|uniref:TonB-dependent receptor n=1 Tax=Runella sp. SP2 TaxID=2268026 RepID=UPI000F099D9A|nr:TonB-dependent receptor [Runella sp. SP2]AYQ32138.1 TonB-dependent receptor [Runella sp. SP2]
MKPWIYTIFGFVGLLGTSAIAQEAKISGKLFNKAQNEPVAFATVKLTSSNGEIKGLFSGENGEFLIANVSPGIYELSVSAVGYDNYTKSGIRITEKNQFIKLDEVEIKSKVNNLAEVIVKSSIGVTKIEPQKVVYTTADLPVAQGASVGDMLRLMPSTAMGGPPGVPRDIRYRGLEKSYTLVLIDGKNAGISGNNREVLLTQIPASAVERIEIIANPGAQYDGDGMNGVVNIILKKNTRFGTHGRLMGGLNSQGGHTLSAQIGHKFEKGEVYGFFDKNQTLLQGTHAITENNAISLYKNNTISGYQNVLSKEDRDIRSHNLKVGTKWDLWKGAQVGAEFINGFQRELKIKTQDTEVLKADKTFSSRTLRTEDQTEDFKFNEYSLNFSQTFAKKGRLTFSYTHVDGFYPKPKYQVDQKLNATGAAADAKPAKTNTFEDSFDRNNFLQSDFSWQQNELLALNAGVKFSGRNRESLQKVDKYDYTKAAYLTTESPANNFDSQENIYAAYAQGTLTKGKLRAILGIRGEYTTFYNKSKAKAFVTEGDYFIPLPSASLVYNIDKTQFLKFTIDRKIRRAAFKDLSPFADSSDVAKIKAGNPLLRPEKAWGFELGYLKTAKNWNAGVNIFRRNIEGLIQKITTDVSPGVVLEQPVNINSAFIQGVELLGAIRPFPIWNINASYSKFTSKLYDETLGGGDAIKDQFAWSAKLISDVEIGKNTFFQMAWNGIGPKISSVKTENTIQYFDASLNHTFLKKKMTIGLRISDIFDTNDKKTREITAAQISDKIQAIAGRQVFVNLSYNF